MFYIQNDRGMQIINVLERINIINVGKDFEKYVLVLSSTERLQEIQDIPKDLCPVNQH